MADCLILKRKQSTKPMGLVSSSLKKRSPVLHAEIWSEKTQSMYEPFLTNGTVSVPGEDCCCAHFTRYGRCAVFPPPWLVVPGVTFLLGNDPAGGNMWSRGDVPPKVVSVPLIQDCPNECAQKFP